ncbi:hypothetical protein BpHYR1_036320 [Brachionus plicatilis]|uniref:Uncharacterized protein n=1 Tax=Brachionus plicatilis TaxID=10195 RepID=A0A3M7PWE3_BRAPC|nr:hypothetical protein BpHYR1_036320 [Brachionus plicatilis]
MQIMPIKFLKKINELHSVQREKMRTSCKYFSRETIIRADIFTQIRLILSVSVSDKHSTLTHT